SSRLQKEYEEMVALVPARILEGYEDPEVLLAGFLDYLKASELDRVKLPIFDLSTSTNSADSLIKLMHTIFLLITPPFRAKSIQVIM
ncbi:hypothetical protein ACFLYW_03535, partial [Thermodesulfobacteriota bacterium]